MLSSPPLRGGDAGVPSAAITAASTAATTLSPVAAIDVWVRGVWGLAGAGEWREGRSASRGPLPPLGRGAPRLSVLPPDDVPTHRRAVPTQTSDVPTAHKTLTILRGGRNPPARPALGRKDRAAATHGGLHCAIFFPRLWRVRPPCIPLRRRRPKTTESPRSLAPSARRSARREASRIPF